MKYISFVRYALIALSIIIVALGLTSGDADTMLRWTEFLIVATVASLVILSIYAMMQDPKSAGRSLMGLLAVLVVVGISFAMSDTTPIVTPAAVYDNPAELIATDTGIFSTYIVFGGAVLAIAGTELYNLIKK